MLSKSFRNGIFLIFFSTNFILLANAQQPLRLWYNHPANGWLESVPLGNGRLGAMPDCGVFNENIVLNDITLWSGSPQDADKPDAYKALPEIRKLIFEGKNAEAQKLVTEKFLCKGKGSGYGNGANDPYGSYQVLGNLHLKYDYGADTALIHSKDYYRGLSLDSAVATCSFVMNGIIYHREYFTSFANDVIIIRLSANKPGKINFTLSLDRPERYKTTVNKDELDMNGQLSNGASGNGMSYLARVSIKHRGGKLIPGDNTLQIKGADEAIIYISAGTNFRNSLYKQRTDSLLKAALAQSYQNELKEHVKDYRKLFDRATLTLDNQNLSQAALPTDERLIAYAKDPSDNGLPVLFFQFGRYLLISSSRPGLLPPNLQGLWANSIQTPWNGDYHLDINIEMNHWPLEVANLPMLNEPFYSLIKGLVIPGSKTAKAYFNSPGWVAFVITNIWGYTSPGEGADWGSALSGSGWLCQVLWNHYAFTGDIHYLKEIYPILKGAAIFYLHAMVKDPNNGWLVTAPSESPENSFYAPDGKVAAISAGPTIDNDIIRELFSHVIDASDILHQDIVFTKELEAAKKQLPPDRADSAGRLMEWLKPFKETDPHHRHMSPVWGLYPGTDISLSKNPEIAEAAKERIIRRGDSGPGWSLAWKMNLWARLFKGEHCFELLNNLLVPALPGNKGDGHILPDLFDAIDGYNSPFQIDANFGGAAGIAEMLVQSQNGYIQFLPALPYQWPNGSFSGFCVRGGGVVSAKWKNGKLQQATLKTDVNHTFNIKIPAKTKFKLTIEQKEIQPVMNNGLIKVHLKKGQIASLYF